MQRWGLMVTLAVMAIATAALVVVLIRGEFDPGPDDTDAWTISRRDNPIGYWFGVIVIAGIVAALGYMLAINHGVDAAWPGFKS